MNLFEMHQLEVGSKNWTGHTCENCGNAIRKNDEKAKKYLCGWCAAVEEDAKRFGGKNPEGDGAANAKLTDAGTKTP